MQPRPRPVAESFAISAPFPRRFPALLLEYAIRRPLTENGPEAQLDFLLSL